MKHTKKAVPSVVPSRAHGSKRTKKHTPDSSAAQQLVGDKHTQALIEEAKKYAAGVGTVGQSSAGPMQAHGLKPGNKHTLEAVKGGSKKTTMDHVRSILQTTTITKWIFYDR